MAKLSNPATPQTAALVFNLHNQILSGVQFLTVRRTFLGDLYMKYVVLLLLAPFFAFANPQVSKAKLNRLAIEFYSSQKSILNIPEQCEQTTPTGPSCADVACDLLGRYGYDDISQVESVGRACRGNRSGACLASSCARLGRYGCDDLSEVTRVATSCRRHFNGECMDLACNLLGRYGCDDISEVERVGVACQGSDAACIRSICKRLGTYGCDDISEVERVANSCKGN